MPSGLRRPPLLWGQAAQASRRHSRSGGDDLAAHGYRSQVPFSAAPLATVPSGPSGTLHTCGSEACFDVWLDVYS